MVILLPPSRDSTGMKLRSSVFRNAATPSGFPNLGCFGVQQACSHTHFLIHRHSHSHSQTRVLFSRVLENLFETKSALVVQWAWRVFFCKQVVQFQKTLLQTEFSQGWDGGRIQAFGNGRL